MTKKYLPSLKHVALSLVAGGLMLSTASAQTLLLRYTFDESSGDAVNHGSAGGSGVFTGGATRTSSTPSGSGFAADISGSGQYVAGGNLSALDGLSSFTLTGWMNLQANPAHGARIMTKQEAWDGASSPGFSFAINNPTAGTISSSNFQLNLALGGEGGFSFNTSGANLDAANQWVFVAVTYDGTAATNNVTFYHGSQTNGAALLGTSGSSAAGTTLATSVEFMVGSTGASAGAASPPAWYDDIRVYSGVLNQAQLEDVRLAAIPEPSTYAAIFGGLALLGAFVYRRRVRK